MERVLGTNSGTRNSLEAIHFLRCPNILAVTPYQNSKCTLEGCPGGGGGVNLV